MSKQHAMLIIAIVSLICLLSQPCSAATTQVHIVKYANDGITILNETTKTYQWMQANMPVLGDGTTHYYHQGPVFVDDITNETHEQELRWNPDEDTNVQEKDMGAVKGTNLKDLCNLVGGMSAGERVKILSSDGWNRWFAYKNVYGYSSREGPIGICWYKDGTYPDSGYTDGMRVVWFADTSTNPWGIHAFGNFDWHEAAAPEYWYYYQSGTENYPTTTGISGQYVNRIFIYSNQAPPIAPVAAYKNATPRTGTAPLTVSFTDQSTGTLPLTYAWDFQNDGSVDSTVKNPSYQYTAAGTYTVKLTVTNAAGSDSEVKAMYITVSAAPVAPVAVFSATSRSGTAPLTVSFTDTSTGTAPLTYAWDFQNDGSVDSTLKSPSYQYTAAGTYTVKLTVTNTAGSDPEVKAGYITVSAAPVAPVAAFSATPWSGTAPLTVSFTDTSTNTPTAWSWSFRNVEGNNTQVLYSTIQNPAHIFGVGNYSIVLDASNSAGHDLSNQVTFINVTAAPIVTNMASNIGIFRPSSGIWSLDSNGNVAWDVSDTSLSWGLPNDVPVIGDWNGDGKDDIGIFRPSSGIWSLDSNGNVAWDVSDTSLSWGLPNDVPVIGDWNGDGKDDIGIFRPSSGIWSLDSNGNVAWDVSDTSLSWGLPNDVPVIGDWNGDGKDDIGIFRPSSGIWSLDSNGNVAWEGSDTSLSWGLPNDKPVIGDWNGDNKDDIGIFRPSTGIWSLDSNGNVAWEGSDTSLSWGLPNDKPVIGDWNGDNKDDIGIFRPSTGIWSLDSNGNVAWDVSDTSLSWGLPGDIPVIGIWS